MEAADRLDVALKRGAMHRQGSKRRGAGAAGDSEGVGGGGWRMMESPRQHTPCCRRERKPPRGLKCAVAGQTGEELRTGRGWGKGQDTRGRSGRAGRTAGKGAPYRQQRRP